MAGTEAKRVVIFRYDFASLVRKVAEKAVDDYQKKEESGGAESSSATQE